jgi:hypothetical protein
MGHRPIHSWICASSAEQLRECLPTAVNSRTLVNHALAQSVRADCRRWHRRQSFYTERNSISRRSSTG